MKTVSAGTITFSDPSSFLTIGKEISYLSDKDKSLTFEQVLSPEYQSRFIPCSQEVFSRPASQCAYWFRISFINKSSSDAWLELGTIAGRYIDFYAPDSTGRYGKPILTGVMRGLETKPYPVNTFWFPLCKGCNQSPSTYYMRIDEETPFEAPLYIGSLQSLYAHKGINDYLVAGFIGAILIMLLYNAFLWLSTREKLYLVYVLYLSLCLLVPTAQNCYPFLTRIGNHTWWYDHLVFIMAVANSTVGIFAIMYLNLKVELPKVYYVMSIMIVLLLVLGLLNFLFPYGYLINTFQVCILLMFMLCLFSGYFLLVKRRKQAFYYSLGWTFMIVFALIFMFTINGFLPYNAFTRNSTYFGIVLETWMFSLALGNRINVLKKERELSQEAMLYKAVENEKLVRSQKEELYKEVIKRTEEIHNKNEALNQMNEQVVKSNTILSEQAENLEILNASKDKFFSIIAHDLRNPFNTIFGFADLIIKNIDKYDKDKIKELVETIRTSSKNTFTLLENLLTWARMQTGDIEYKPEIIDLRILFMNAVTMVEAQAMQKNITINQAYNNCSEIYGDNNMISTVLRNLLTNAIKYTNDGGLIFISSSHNGHFCEISVKDNGVGIPTQSIEKLFRVDSKFNTKGTSNERGTGLGLILCKEFVEKHGGSIMLKSGEGVGSEFLFTLPVASN